MSRRFAGKVMVVTGAAQGIGARVAERAAAERAEVLVVHRSPHRDEVGAILCRSGHHQGLHRRLPQCRGPADDRGAWQRLNGGGRRDRGVGVHALPEEPELRPYLAKAKSSGAQAVHAFNAGGKAISFVEQYDSFGMKEALPLHGAGFLTSLLYVDAQGPAAEGVVTALHYVSTLGNEVNRQFAEAFKAKAGHPPSEYAVHCYDATSALTEAVKSGATDRESLGAALQKTSFDGPRGATAIDPATNNIVQPIYVCKMVACEGVRRPKRCWRNCPPRPTRPTAARWR